MLGQIARALTRLAQIVAGDVVKNELSGQALKRRSGSLARSIIGIGGVLPGGQLGWRVGVLKGPSLAYARIQHDGGVIRPVNAKALAMPVGPAVTPAGVARYKGPRTYPRPLGFIPLNRGNVVGLLVEKPVKGVKRRAGTRIGRVAYILLKQVKLKPTNFITKRVTPRIKETMGIVEQAIADAILGRLKT